MQIITANIGCNTPGELTLTMHTVVDEWRRMFPDYDMQCRMAYAKSGEPTVVIRTAMATAGNKFYEFIGRIYRLSVILKQDCIAVSGHSSTPGELIGPLAANWGEYNEDFFIRYNAD